MAFSFTSLFKRKAEPARGPQTAAKRNAAVNALQLSAHLLSATRNDGTTSSWGSLPLTADQIITRHWRVLVARSREQAVNNDYMKSFLRMCRQNIVGHQGVVLQAQARDANGKLDELANDAIEAAWATWGERENCDVAGKSSWIAIQKACVTSAAKDGEFFVQVIRGADAGPHGFALQVIDPARCPADYSQAFLPNGNRIANGIEVNKFGRPVAYLFDSSEQSTIGISTYSFGGRTFTRIPADEIIHGYKLDMLEQKRGLPWAASGLYRMRHLVGFEEASVVNARVGAAKQGYIEWEEGFGPELDEEDTLDLPVDPGSTFVLPEGARYKSADPSYPTGEFAPFYKTMLRGIAAGMGVAYNALANDLEGVNFSSIRQGALDEREHWKDEQQWLIEELCMPVFKRWLAHALLSGHIVAAGKPLRPEKLAKYRQVEWQGRRWSWIDPQSEVKAAVDSKNNLLTSPGQIIREQGRDPSFVWREIANDIESMRAAGIPDEYIQLAMGKQLNWQQPQQQKLEKASA